MKINLKTLTKTFDYKERGLNGRLLFQIRAEVYYYLDDPTKTKIVSSTNYDIRSLEISFSFPEDIFYSNYFLKEYIKEIEEQFNMDIINKGKDFDPQFLVDLARLIKTFPKIERYYLPSFALTSLSSDGEIDVDGISAKIGEDAKFPFLQLAIYYLHQYTSIEILDNNEKLEEVYSQLQSNKSIIHPWVYFIVSEFCRLRIAGVL